MNIKIIVAAHKPYFMPDDPAYFPLQAGADINPPLAWQGDNSGENISAKNRNFCELTCLYWAWKNLDADYLGLVHYRRHFSGKSAFDPKKRIITSQKLEKLFSDCDIIMPKKRNYFIESNFQQYIHAHHPEDLEVTEAVITEKYPDYLPAYNAVMKRSSGYRFNMCIMRRELLNDYCKWLFDILFEVENVWIFPIIQPTMPGFSALSAKDCSISGSKKTTLRSPRCHWSILKASIGGKRFATSCCAKFPAANGAEHTDGVCPPLLLRSIPPCRQHSINSPPGTTCVRTFPPS